MHLAVLSRHTCSRSHIEYPNNTSWRQVPLQWAYVYTDIRNNTPVQIWGISTTGYNVVGTPGTFPTPGLFRCSPLYLRIFHVHDVRVPFAGVHGVDSNISTRYIQPNKTKDFIIRARRPYSLTSYYRLYRRLRIGRDVHLDQSKAYHIL